MIFDGKDATNLFLKHFELDRSDPGMGLLKNLVRAFAALPYENVTKIIRFHKFSGWEERLRKPAEVVEDHVRIASGGTCFSLTETLGSILQELGFGCRYRMADMHYGSNIHCALIVALGDSRFLVDPGYLLGRPVPLPSEGSVTIDTPFNTVRIERAEGSYNLYTREKGVEKWRYRLKDREVSETEFKDHWIRSFSFNMMNNILITRATEEGHLYVRDRHFRWMNRSSRESAKIKDDYENRLCKIFGIQSEAIREALTILSDSGFGSRGKGR
jgi:arylamine N-acetyltransferase